MSRRVCTHCEKPIKRGESVLISCGGICFSHHACQQQVDAYLERCDRQRRERKKR